MHNWAGTDKTVATLILRNSMTALAKNSSIPPFNEFLFVYPDMFRINGKSTNVSAIEFLSGECDSIRCIPRLSTFRDKRMSLCLAMRDNLHFLCSWNFLKWNFTRIRVIFYLHRVDSPLRTTSSKYFEIEVWVWCTLLSQGHTRSNWLKHFLIWNQKPLYVERILWFFFFI